MLTAIELVLLVIRVGYMETWTNVTGNIAYISWNAAAAAAAADDDDDDEQIVIDLPSVNRESSDQKTKHTWRFDQNLGRISVWSDGFTQIHASM